MSQINKKKIFNDPVYGFVSIPHEILFDLIEHPYFQRLRRIRQLGMTHYVYPGALHTRFHHAIGAVYLMTEAIEELRFKGHDITVEEEKGACIAILLHDIGHGPYSHTLEQCLVKGISHEFLSAIFMEALNKEFNGQLTTAIQIFKNEYPKHFLHQLISSQLDMDRMDYLKRDGFFTGVQEGAISHDRIIKMLDIRNDQLVVEAKGIYSIEKFILARRLMYWQVYLHKTVVAAEQLLVNILVKAMELVHQGHDLFASPALKYFLTNNVTKENFLASDEPLKQFALLDDYDVFTSIKVWANYPDKTLAILCDALVNRHLFKVELGSKPIAEERIEKMRLAAEELFHLPAGEGHHLVTYASTSNSAYNMGENQIMILFKNGITQDVASASDQLNIEHLSQPVTKYYLCYPKELIGI